VRPPRFAPTNWSTVPSLRHRLLLALCIIGISLTPAGSVAQPPTTPTNKTDGWWSPTKYDWGVKAVHMILMRGTSDASLGSHSRVLFYNSNDAKVWRWNSSDATDGLPTSGMIYSEASDSDLFCSGHSGLPDGRILVTGGNEVPGPGIDHTNIFLQSSNIPGQSWVDPRPPNMYEDRWYPTNTALPDGRVLVLSGLEGVQVCAFGGANSSGTANNDFVLFGLRGIPVHTTPVDATPPGARQDHTAIFDHAITGSNCPGNTSGFRHLQRMIVFGGYETSSSSPLGDVWALSRTVLSEWSWTQVTPDPDPVHGVPSARSAHTAVFCGTDSSMVVYGGLDASGTALDDVWKLYLYRAPISSCAWRGYWRRLSVGGDTDLKRYNHTAVYDSDQNRMLVFGGRTTGGYASTNVWSLSLTGTPTWTTLSLTGTPPSAREGHAAIYDRFTSSTSPRMLVFGGRNGSTFHNSVHVLSGGDWSSLATTGTPPSGRADFSLTHDTYAYSNNRLILFGGESTSGITGDVWDLRLSVTPALWTERMASVPSGVRARHAAVHDTRPINATRGEIFDPTVQSPGNPWTQLSLEYRKWMKLYPLMFVLPGGKIAHVGPEIDSQLLDLSSPSSAWMNVGGDGLFTVGTAAAYLPGRVLKCGSETQLASNRSAHIDLTTATPTWTEHIEEAAMGQARTKHNLTVLADGTVLLSGGMNTYATAEFTNKTYTDLYEDFSTRYVQIWNPSTLSWSASLADEPAIRDYHSSALLLPDGKVLSGGGELNANTDKMLATIYWPPYLFDSSGAVATRPVITQVEPRLVYGSTLTLWLQDTTGVAKVSLVKPGAVTHQFNQDQRFLEPVITCSAIEGNQRRITIQGPSDASYAPPGDYMLFVIKWNGVPSVARWVRVTPENLEVNKSGTLTSNEVWTANQSYYLSSTVTVPSGRTLTIEPGTWVRAASSAALKVDGGTLLATDALFVGSGCGGTWPGVQVANGTTTMTRCTIRNATVGVDFSGGTGGGLIQSSLIANPRTVGVLINQAGVVTLDRDTIDCPADLNNTVGISVSELASGTNTITRCRIYGKNRSGSKGILIKKGVAIRGNRIRDFKASNARGMDFVLAASDTSATVTVDIESSAPADTSVILNCRTGIHIDSYSRPKIRRVRVDDTTDAFWVRPLAQPDIGLSETSMGLCDVSRSVTHHIRADTRYSGLPPIDAYYNYWGTTSSSEIAAMMDGYVNWSPFLQSDPLENLGHQGPWVFVTPMPTPPSPIAVFPNPFNESTQIRYVVPADGLPVEVTIFDVAGRRTRNWQHASLPAGEYELVWNGTTDGGVRVASGVYFCRLEVGGVVVARSSLLVTRGGSR
jgi:hypothetical protein